MLWPCVCFVKWWCSPAFVEIPNIFKCSCSSALQLPQMLGALKSSVQISSSRQKSDSLPNRWLNRKCHNLANAIDFLGAGWGRDQEKRPYLYNKYSAYANGFSGLKFSTGAWLRSTEPSEMASYRSSCSKHANSVWWSMCLPCAMIRVMITVFATWVSSSTFRVRDQRSPRPSSTALTCPSNSLKSLVMECRMLDL